VAFDHHPDDRAIAFHDLVHKILHDQRLQAGILARVGVAAVHHQLRPQPRLLELLLAERDVHRVIIRLLAAAQHHVPALIAASADDRALAILINTEEAVRVGRGVQRVNGKIQAAVGAVLETDGRGQAARHLAMGLRLRGTRANRRPANQVSDVLRRNRVERLGRRREAQLGEVQQQLTSPVQALLDVEGVIKMGIVDQPLPANGGPRLLEVDPHDDEQGIRNLVAQRLQPPSVVLGGVHVMDGTGPRDDDQTMVLAIKDVFDSAPPGEHRFARLLGQRQLRLDLRRGRQDFLGAYIDVVDVLVRHSVSYPRVVNGHLFNDGNQ